MGERRVVFRRKAVHEEPGAEALPVPRARDGCILTGCTAGGVRCGYVDKRSRTCTSTWCSAHWTLVVGRPYCRRHASTVQALGGADTIEGRPDLDNRAPSLVAWVSDEVDIAVRAALDRVAVPGAVLVVDPVRLLRGRGASERSWHRTWKLVDHSGVLNRVAIEVDEANDVEVRARVGRDVIGHGVPPWIARRRTGTDVAPDVDARQRNAFRESMARSIELVVTRQETVPLY